MVFGAGCPRGARHGVDVLEWVMLDQLIREEKLQLLRFLCAFAWADLDIADSERAMVRDIMARMGLDADDARQVEAWLDHPPSEEDLDPLEIPEAHRRLFLDAALAMVGADGDANTMEIENYALFASLMEDVGVDLDADD